MSEDEGDEEEKRKALAEFVQKAIRDRNQRDVLYLRKSRIDTMQRLASDYREWFYAEVKDLHVIVDTLKSLIGHSTVATRLGQIETEVIEIEKSYMKKGINPMKKIAGKETGPRTEEEHHTMFETAMHDVWLFILKLRSFRYELDLMIAQAGVPLPKAPPLPKGLYATM